MIVKVSDNIISPLCMNTAENYAAVKAGRSELSVVTDYGTCLSLSRPR